MTLFNIPKKQLRLSGWKPYSEKKRYQKKLCQNCQKGCYFISEVDEMYIEFGNTSRKRCMKCKICLAKNCCGHCGSSFQNEEDCFLVTESYCGVCKYIGKYSPAGSEWDYINDYE